MKSSKLLQAGFVFLLTGVLVLSASGQSSNKSYLLLSRTQGAGSTPFAQSLGPALVANLKAIGVVIATSSDPNFATWAATLRGVQAVAEDPEIQWLPKEPAVQLTGVTADGVNSEPYNGYLWNLRVIHADVTAAHGDLGAGARVAVIDEGMDLANPDLASNINQALAISFVPGEVVQPQCSAPCFNHGTHVGGIIAAAINGKGVQGVAPKAELVPIKVLQETGENAGSGSFSWIIEGLEYATSIHADVANMSLGAVFNVAQQGKNNQGLGTLLAALDRAVNHATASGVLVVSAAGNNGVNLNSNIMSIPAQSGNGMAISATGPSCQTDFDRFASYSNYGQSVISLAAPGGGVDCANVRDYILSDSVGAYYFAAGTSMATPHVSGVAALIVGKFGHIGPTAIKTILQNAADDLYKAGADPYSGHGRVNAQRALGD
jgi:subtilisin family serine protease